MMLNVKEVPKTIFNVATKESMHTAVTSTRVMGLRHYLVWPNIALCLNGLLEYKNIIIQGILDLDSCPIIEDLQKSHLQV